jgi:pyrimidine-nucleoside phosphorylase
MLAGRGLGHTQGTIDKLETIPGYHPSLSLPKFQQIVKDVGISIMAQTEEICPADLKIYALRDITNTVGSFPLICGSIMSKKIAEGIQGLVLDIKVGNGAFMKTLSEAKALGALLKCVGQFYEIHVSTCYTGMEQPLGNTAGLWCEVMESIKCLKGNGPEDVMTVVYHLGEEALCHAGESNPRERLKSAIENGYALEKFEQMVIAHGGSIKSLNNPKTNNPLYHGEVRAENDGYISYMDTLNMGLAVVHLGGGRLQKGDLLDPTVGIVFHKKTGDSVNTDEPLLEYFCSDKDKLESSKLYFKKAIEINSEPPKPIELIYK